MACIIENEQVILAIKLIHPRADFHGQPEGRLGRGDFPLLDVETETLAEDVCKLLDLGIDTEIVNLPLQQQHMNRCVA